MAGAPPLEIRIDRDGAWRAGVGLLVGLSCAAMLAWWMAQSAPAPLWADAVAVAACIGAFACGIGLVRGRPVCALRWDRQQWWFARSASDARSGDLGVAIDLGAWMLLRFVPQGGRVWRDAIWIPVQRRGLEAGWHGLRCAVHASRSHESPPA